MSASTNPIGKGTCNFPLNMPIEESQIWGRLFGESAKRSKGEFLKDALLEWAKQNHPEHAAQIAAIRQRRASMIGLMLFLTVIIAPAIGLTKNTCKDIRRAASVRTVRNPRRNDYDLELVEA